CTSFLNSSRPKRASCTELEVTPDKYSAHSGQTDQVAKPFCARSIRAPERLATLPSRAKFLRQRERSSTVYGVSTAPGSKWIPLPGRSVVFKRAAPVRDREARALTAAPKMALDRVLRCCERPACSRSLAPSSPLPHLPGHP